MTNTQPKHTPGPYTVVPDNGNGFYVQALDLPEETIVARCIDYPHMCGLTEGTWEAKANAHLFAAAPDLLRALKTIVAAGILDLAIRGADPETIDPQLIKSPIANEINAAIAKAEGRG